jgi:hypothetical protein
MLEHIHGDNLKKLEEKLASLPGMIRVISVSNIHGTWYIHYQLEKFKEKKNGR